MVKYLLTAGLEAEWDFRTQVDEALKALGIDVYFTDYALTEPA